MNFFRKYVKSHSNKAEIWLFLPDLITLFGLKRAQLNRLHLQKEVYLIARIPLKRLSPKNRVQLIEKYISHGDFPRWFDFLAIFFRKSTYPSCLYISFFHFPLEILPLVSQAVGEVDHLLLGPMGPETRAILYQWSVYHFTLGSPRPVTFISLVFQAHFR